jgi:hypothetical protein
MRLDRWLAATTDEKVTFLLFFKKHFLAELFFEVIKKKFTLENNCERANAFHVI